MTGFLSYFSLVVSGQSEGLLRVGVQASSQSLVDAMYGPLFEAKLSRLNYTVNSTALINDAAIYAAAEASEFDVFYGGPTIFNCLQSQYGLRGIAAAIDIENSQETPYLGAEMVARTTSGITAIGQVSGTRVAVTQLTHTVGCLAQWGEMRRNGLDLFVDTRAVILANTSASVLDAVATGVADVGFLRAGTVEQQMQGGVYPYGMFGVVNRLDEDFPWPVSTPLYPAVLVAVSRNMTDDLATEVARAMFEEDGVSLQANISRWVPLQDYVPTQSLQSQLGVMYPDLSQCYRVTNYYDSIVCPAGYSKQERSRLQTACDAVLTCPKDLYTCICGPCVKLTSHKYRAMWLAVLGVIPLLFFAWMVFIFVQRKRHHIEWIHLSTLNVRNDVEERNRHGTVYSGSYKGSEVELKRIKMIETVREEHDKQGWRFRGRECVTHLTGQQTSKERIFKQIYDLACLRHPNIEQGIGATVKAGDIMLVSAKCSNGNVKDLLYNPTVELEGGMVASLLYDIARGLEYLESQKYMIECEDLTAETVVLNEDFRAMIQLNNVVPQVTTTRPAAIESRMRDDRTLAFGRLMYDMIYRRQRLLSTVDQGIVSFRSYDVVKKESENGIIDLMNACLSDDPGGRPSMQFIIDALKRRSDRSFGDTLTQAKIRGILQQMLPVDVVNDIKMNRRPPPQKYEDVSFCVIDVSHKALKLSSIAELEEIGSSVRSICESLSTRSCLMIMKPLSEDTRFITVGNLMSPLQNHVSVTLDFAIEAVRKISRVPLRNNQGFVKVQVGVHVGRVTSHVIGSEHARYSLLGPDMVTVSQLQLKSEPDHLLVSKDAANRALLTRKCRYNFFTGSIGRTNNSPKVHESVWLCATGSQSQPQTSKTLRDIV